MIERQGPGAGKAIATMSIGESLDNASDGFDPTTYIQSLQFKLRCYEASGEDFQRLFEDIIKRVTPEFMQIRPYGNIGDRKCDGLLYADGTIFQVYSPDALKQAQLKKKINEDLDGAVKHWGDTLKKWVFVYNVRQGLAPDIPKILQQKQKQYRNIEIDHWSNHYLWQMARGLSLQQRAEVLGAPVVEKLEQLGFKPQKNAVCRFLEAIEEKFKNVYLLHRSEQPIILKDQYIPIQVTVERRYKHEVESSWGYFDSEAELKRAYALKGSEESQRTQVDWKQAKKQHRRIMVLADPGMGKSTLLKMEAGLSAKEEQESLENNLKTIEDVTFPLFLRLSELAESTSEVTAKIVDAIPQLIAAKYDTTFPAIQSLLEQKLKTGKCLLLLDALDEVPYEQQPRNRLFEKLNDFLQNYPCPIICTSRIVGYSGAFVAGVKEVEIVPFSQKQTEEYIESWLKNAVGYLNDDTVSASSLIRELRNKPQIRGLAQNPLLLSLICSLYQEKGLTLPARRCQVYEQAVRYMLGKWSKNRNPELNDAWIDAKMELLEELAYQFSYESKDIFTKRELRQEIDKYLRSQSASSDFRDKNASCIITELSEQDGILQKLHEDGDQYIFLHRTFQEYLTANYIYYHRQIEKLVSKHLTHKRWQEVFLIVAGLMRGGADELLLLMEKEARKYINTAKLQDLLDWASEATTDSHSNASSIAKRAAAILLVIERVLATHLDLDRVVLLDHSYNLVRELVRAFDLPFTHTFARDLTIDSVLGLALARAYEFERKKIFQAVNFAALTERLNLLKAQVPNNQQPPEFRQAFDNSIQQIWFKALNLNPKLVNLSEEEAKALENYFYANLLILMCKEAAVRMLPKTWEGIEERMLRVPGD